MKYQSRIEILKKIKFQLNSKQDEICSALHKDFRKSKQEVILTEIYPALLEIDYFLKNLKSLMKPKKVSTPLTMLGSSSHIEYIPKGRILIISPSNYPFYLAIAPIVNAVAAGNSIDLIPAELTPNCSNILKDILENCLDSNSNILGSGKENIEKTLLKPYDHIFFTGSTTVGKTIMQAAAKQLCPVTLELGGKSPVIVDKSANLAAAAQKIIWAKSLNSGQTCVAPDYIYVEESIEEEFYNSLKEEAINFSKNYPQAGIISEQHFKKLKNNLAIDLENGAELIFKGDIHQEENRFGLNIIKNVNWSHEIMAEEIFGPILPCLRFKNFEEVINLINRNDAPLASYLFSEDSSKQKIFKEELRSGGACINHLVLHLANHNLPFGGLGKSGIGAYHGKWGFEELSHKKAVFKAGAFDSMKLFYELNNEERFEKIISFLKP